ncbi:putative E3 ubiquitin-protein ligase ATL42 [Glarea lozoyensis 74030]|uniref:Putative E3 ubiquitin-protein ligase ATL42 n=1 Tax=Glarea lozoyensis (strain ATCC 74030 / MF5533) TaxID=1104152 RepID=H0EE13_GLAL7|nr:putative E3 ubiquitin-protein ligase ATL42 [Glarea lozoyensis 74030]
MSDINQMSNLEEDTNMERTWLAEEMENLRTWDGEPHDYVPRLFTSQKEALDFAKPLLDRISEINDDLEEHSLDTENSRKHNVVPTSELPFLQKAFEALLISGKERVYQLQASERQDNNEEARPETTADVTIFGVNPDTFNLPKLTKSVAEELVDHIYQLDLIAESIQLVEVTNAISARQLSLRNNAEPLQLFHPLPKGSEKECSICRSEEKSEEYVQLDCKARHVFGKECLRVWLLEHNSCPYCREMFDRALYRWPEREVVCPRWLRVLKEVR